MADTGEVTIRNSRQEERTVPEAAVPFFVNAETDWVVLTSDGRKNTAATNAAKEK